MVESGEAIGGVLGLMLRLRLMGVGWMTLLGIIWRSYTRIVVWDPEDCESVGDIVYEKNVSSLLHQAHCQITLRFQRSVRLTSTPQLCAQVHVHPNHPGIY